MKIKFTRVSTYEEECEADVDGDDPMRSIIDAEYNTFLVTKRTMVDMDIGRIEAA